MACITRASNRLLRELERENKNLRTLLDKASQALACFVDLRGMTASELKSAHNGICILLEVTKILDAIKDGVRIKLPATVMAAMGLIPVENKPVEIKVPAIDSPIAEALRKAGIVKCTPGQS